MHFKSQGSLNCGEVDEVERDAPSGADSDDGAVRNDFHEEFYNADSESSDNDDELPYNEVFLNPVYDIEDLNIVDPDDTTGDDTNTGEEDEEPFEGIFNDFNFVDREGSSSSSEMSDDYEEWEIIEPNNEQQDASNNPEKANLNSNQQGTSHNSDNEDLNNVQQGALSNQKISTTNDIEKANLNSTRQGEEPYNSDTEELNKAQQGASSNQEISTTNNIERANLNSTQQGASYNSDNEDYNNAQQGASSNQEISTTNDIERANLNSTQGELYNSDKEDLNDVQQGASNNLETNITNDINPKLFNDDCTECIFVTCDDECIEPIAISAPSFGTFYSPNIYYGPHSPASVNLNEFNYHGPSNSGYPPFYPSNNGARGDAGNMQTSGTPGSVDYETTQSSENTSGPPGSNATFSSQHHASGNPGYATLHLLPRDTLLHNPGYPNSHYHLCPVCRCYPGPYSSIFTTTNNRSYRNLYSRNHNAPDYPDYTGPRLANYSAPNNHGYVAPTPRNDPTRNNPPRNNASYRTPQASGYDASDNLASGTTQPTNYIAPGGSADGPAKVSAYEAPNAPGYCTSTSFDQSDQHSPGQGTSVPPAYLGPHTYDYGNPYSPNYIAPESSSGATHYSQFNAPSSGYPTSECPDTLDISENVVSQSPVTQVLSNDEAYGSTGPYNYGGPGTSGYSAPARNEPTRINASYRTPQASGYDDSDNIASGTTQSTNYIATGASANGTAKASAYEAPNASGYGISTSFDQSDQHSPGQGTSVPPAYLGPHTYDYGNPYSPNYIAPESSSGATHYSQFNAPSSSYPTSECPDTLDISENVVSQSPVTQVLSNDEASGSTGPYNYGGPGTSGYSAPARNEPTRINASYRTPQASGYDDSDNIASGTTQSTNYIATGASANGTAKASAYEAPNASGYGTSTSFDQSGQLSPGQGTSVPPAYVGPHSYDYGNPYSSSGCPDTLDVSENVTSQSPVTQVLSNDEASGSTASYNYSDPSTSGYGVPVRNEPTRDNASYRTPQAPDASNNLAPVTTGYGRPGWFFFTVYSGPDSISNNSPNCTEYNASGMSRDAELGPSGGQRGRRQPFNSRFMSRSLPNSTRRRGRGRGDKHGQ